MNPKLFSSVFIGIVVVALAIGGGFALQPVLKDSWHTKASEAAQADDLVALRKVLDRFKFISPGDPLTPYYRSFMAFASAVESESAEDYQTVIRESVRALELGLEEDHPELYRPLMKRIARSSEAVGDFEAAEEYYREFDSAIGSLDGYKPILRIAGVHYHRFSDALRAREILESIQVGGLSPADRGAYYRLAHRVAYVNEEYKKAISFAKNALEEDLRYPWDAVVAHTTLALAGAALGDTGTVDHALFALKEISALGSDASPSGRVYATCSRARGLLALDDYAAVLNVTGYLGSFLGEIPVRAYIKPQLDCLYAQGIAEYKLDNRAEARKHLEKYRTVFSFYLKLPSAGVARDNELVVSVLSQL